MIRRWIMTLMLCCTLPLAASAKGWETPSYRANLTLLGTSRAFPGSALSGPDRSAEPRAEVGTANRLSRSLKLGLSASAGGRVQQEFTKANYGWVGLGATLRRARTVYSLEGEYTPSRNKFPTDPEEGGRFHAWELVGGIRQPVGSRMRLRAEGIVGRETFEPLFSVRDARSTELKTQLNFAAGPSVDLRVQAIAGHDETQSRKFTKGDHSITLGAAWSDSLWRADLSTETGSRRYTKAILGDSNFRRRDQWIDLEFRLTRRLNPGLSAALGAAFTDQTSSRVDRNYTVHTFTLGFEWTGGGN